MQNQHLLPDSKYIDTNAGLKYLNNNRELYLKILNRFFTRYREFDIKSIAESNFKNEMHTLKGLSSTLGMDYLTDLAKSLYDEQSEDLFNKFTQTLNSIIATLKSMQPKSILILSENHEEIDTLLEILEEDYDLIITITEEDALESIDKEQIDIILLNPMLTTDEIENKLQQKSIVSINIPQSINPNTLQLTIKNI